MTPNEIIRQRFPHERTQGIADDLNMSYTQVANRAHKMGLKKLKHLRILISLEKIIY